jgi:PKD repeat protein
VNLTVTDDQGTAQDVSQAISVSESPGSSGAFLESGGLLSMEAEHFTTQIDRGAHTWVETTGQAGFTGSSAMLADPNLGQEIKKADAMATSPELIYEAEFETPGTYYVWVRLFAPSTNDNTIHAGYNEAISASKMETQTYGSWTWANLNTKGQTSTVGVTEAGSGTVHLWLREDGLYVDKLVLAIDPGYTPSGVGPPESPQSGGGGNPSPTASFTHTSTNLSVSFSDASTDDGTVASWSWDFGDGNASREQKPTHAYGSAGT